MLKVGITGGIGSGKTTICRIFEALDVPVYYADDRSKWLQQYDPQVVVKIKNLLGEHIYKVDGTPDRKAIAAIVFANESKLRALEGILHPAVQVDFRQWAATQQSAYVLKEAALLYESGSYKELDKMIVVTAPEELRIQRTMERDHISPEQVQARMEKQWPEARKAALADWRIINDNTRMLIPQVLEIHTALLALAAHSQPA